MRGLRVLVAKPGLDGHDRGAKLVTRVLRDAGFEVIYTGIRTPIPAIVAVAAQEDVSVIGLSILSGGHLSFVADLAEEMRRSSLTDVGVVLGGIIPGHDVPELERLGVAAVLRPGATTEQIVREVERAARPESALVAAAHHGEQK